MNYSISRATSADAQQLKAIAIAAKAHWGYSTEWMACWTALVSVTEKYVQQHAVYKALSNEMIVGWHAVIVGHPTAALDHLWVIPAFIGKGVGRALFEHARALAQQQGATRLEIEAEPNALGFYQHMGAVVIGELPSAMGRTLPLLELVLGKKSLER